MAASGMVTSGAGTDDAGAVSVDVTGADAAGAGWPGAGTVDVCTADKGTDCVDMTGAGTAGAGNGKVGGVVTTNSAVVSLGTACADVAGNEAAAVNWVDTDVSATGSGDGDEVSVSDRSGLSLQRRGRTAAGDAGLFVVLVASVGDFNN